MAVACLEVYHLLPSPAIRFMEELINLVLRMESCMPHDNTSRELNSPYRPPLIKFLNRYATDSVNFFLSNIGKEDAIKLFRGILRSPIAGPLREELSKYVNTAQLVVHV
jgi:transformation/transcription domain-associated protein